MTLDARAAAPRARAARAPFFSEVLELVSSGDLTPLEKGARVDVTMLALGDFHALRAIATRVGWLAEEPIEIACRNCSMAQRVSPCACLELGPFVDGELDDDELDVPLDLTKPHAIPVVHLAGGGTATDVTLGPLTFAQASPLYRALRRRRFVVTDRVVQAMGISALGPLRDPRRIADMLAACSDDAWAAIGDLFLRAHYVPRLSSIAICPECGARNDVDAPYEREFEPWLPATRSNGEVFPDFDTFAAHARARLERTLGASADDVRLVVDGNVPACDDGGEPLLGAYIPPGGDPVAPVGSPEVVLYYRTFEAVWAEDGAYDWAAEIDETLEHELEHHAGWREGHDPMDDEERAEIAGEHARVVGRKTAAVRSAGAAGRDFREFVARTWLIWAIVAAVTVAVTVCNH